MIIFDARKIISFKNFKIFLNEESVFFNTAKKVLFYKYDILKPCHWNGNVEKYQHFRDEYRELVQKIIKDVIAYYRAFLPQKCLITEFGSFVKRTERILSDIDFTICYDEPKTEIYECAEELIDYTLATILGYSIDRVHGNFQHYPRIEGFSELTENDNLYRIIFDETFIDYKCGPKTLAENLTNIKNVRNYQTLLKSFEIKNQKKADIDSLYSIEILENTTEHDFFKDLSILEKEFDVCSGYKFNIAKSYLQKKIKISELRNMFKVQCINELYIFLAKLRKTKKINNAYSMNIDVFWKNKIFSDFWKDEELFRLKESFYKLLFHWNRLELTLSSRKIELGSHCHKEFLIEDLNNFLFEDWNKFTSIETMFSTKNEIIDILKIGLSKLKW